MSTVMDFHSQIASIMEVLANAAVAEMCKVVDDRYAVVRLELSRNQQENESLRKKIKVLELQVARYRAERMEGAEGSSVVSRAVRLPSRQNTDPLAGPTLQGRTRFLTRDPGTQLLVEKIHSVNLNQDPDHKVVITTKSGSPESEEEGKLLIIKVEGTMETGTTNHKAPIDPCTSTTSLPADTTYARQHSETEGQRCLGSNAQHEGDKMHEVQGVTPEKHSPSQIPLGWQETSQTEDRERPSCSTRTAETVAGKASFNRVKTNLVSGFPTVSKRLQSDVKQACPATGLDTIGIKSLTCAAEDSCGGDDGAEKVTPLKSQDDTSGRSQYEPLLCIQISEPTSEVMLEGNATYSLLTFHNPLDSMAALDSQQQQIQHSWSGIRPMENGHFSSQNHHCQASSNQNQESGSAEWQQPCLPYACTFCSRRYAHLSKLRLHERFHRGEKPHQCIQCGKSFVQACSLKRHQMVHTGEKPFPCPHCGKQFSTSTNLKVHQSVHTGEKSFHCSKCGKNFSFLSSLIKHRALHTARQSKLHRDQSSL